MYILFGVFTAARNTRKCISNQTTERERERDVYGVGKMGDVNFNFVS